MKILLVTLVGLFVIACSKDNDTPQPVPPGADSLGAWTKHATGNNFTITDIVFVDPARGYLVDQSGIRHSVDSGKTWSPSFTSSLPLYTIQFLGSQYGYAVGAEMAYTFTNGASWRTKVVPAAAADVAFLTPSTGVLATNNGLYHTVDTGNTWNLILPGNWTALHFSSAQTGLAGRAGSPPAIFITNDGGTTWMLQHNVTQSASSIFTLFTQGMSGWAVTNGPILKTVNAGQTWTSTGVYPGAFDIQFLTPTTGYFTVANKIGKSTDGGVTWKQDAKLGTRNLIELFFLDAQHGWAAGDSGTVLRYKPN